MKMLHSEKGQLLLPILAVLFLFGLFWVTYVLWCRQVYLNMRMDVASDATALSAAREEAAILIYIATYQMLESTMMPEFKDGGVMQKSVQPTFENYNKELQRYEKSFSEQVFLVAKNIAQLNGANIPAVPVAHGNFSATDNFNDQLDSHGVTVLFLAGIWPAGGNEYPKAYFTRRWSSNTLKAQPTHESHWATCHDSICENGHARLWLDVDPGSWLDNGGFPSANRSLLRSIGIQCFYPQFNARLLPKS